jgi:uncharacterized lipoprotein YddW (UPF0748 family)
LKYRWRITSIAKLQIALAIAMIFSDACSATGNEMRGLWVDAFGPGFHNKEEVTKLVEDCRHNNFNAVFVEMRKRGDAYYFPQSPNEDLRTDAIAKDFDALEEIVKQCHAGEPRIQVHCWLVGYFVWAWDKPPPQPGHAFNKHPDYLTKDSIGQKFVAKGYYLDPGNPRVNTLLLNTAKDVVKRYDIDGLHWDYLRYPTKDSGYNEVALKRYKAEFAVTNNPAPNDPQFSTWRRRQISDFVRWSTVELLRLKPRLILSASVFSNYKDSYNDRFQNWVEFNRDGLLDATVPMDFSRDNRFIFEPRATFAFTNQWKRAIWLGEGGYLNNGPGAAKQLGYARTLGFAGTVLYCYNTPTSDVIETNQVEKVVDGTVTIDNTGAKVVGKWIPSEFGDVYGDNCLYKGKGDGKSCVIFSTNLPVSGKYAVLEWHVAGTNRATNVPYLITHDGGTAEIKVDQSNNGSRWNLLGMFGFRSNNLAEVRVTDGITEPKAVVVADAIRWVPVTNVLDVQIPGPELVMQRKREASLVFIKNTLQPNWMDVPILPWKTNRSFSVIAGRVSNAAKEPIYNAVVSIVGIDNKTQRTDVNGTFAFFDVPLEFERIKVGVKSNNVIRILKREPLVVNWCEINFGN